MAEIISLKQARKRLERARKDEQAAENRARFGRTKAEREREEALRALDQTRLDAHRRDDDEPA